ncbi:hypothetical protein TBLA_0D04340 [Henningerozyma blattae CBS 6284]|uniref:Ammonia transport outward protein 2 n=1 Tax=Henningerozyma blattae (strain ATCC 34711 / CBS 6284 / DSM 70876 / NBRC 10599 / NRRL Y-10934 / UCD 77-7) TaxID=1071380 RepID=I2H3H8_HENB6|nr:hypothetical protein TBLA_0D04340 [Tetrapisispora blattae CBS 6284]CCH60930.1 hypothetical protein TBLA_0D04340 [Tetrapisispora blattae CBS 6284]
MEDASSLEDSSLSDKIEEPPKTYTDTDREDISYHSSHYLRQSTSNSPPTIERVYTVGDNQEFIVIGNQKFLKQELIHAFGGTLNPSWQPPPAHRFGNPAPLGLCAFALTTFVLCAYNAKAQGIHIPNVVVGPAMFYGGIVQVIAGIWEIAVENTFGGTALCSYGGFWMSFASLYIPWFGIQAAYEGHEKELGNAIGFYLLGWCIFTYGLALCTMKSTVMFFTLFFLLGHTFLLLSIGSFTGKEKVTQAGGILGIIVAFVAWYNAFAGLTDKHNSYVVLGSIPLPSNDAHV